MTFGEHNENDFLEADVIVYSSSVNPHLPQLEMAEMLAVKFTLNLLSQTNFAVSQLLLFVEALEEPQSLI